MKNITVFICLFFVLVAKTTAQVSLEKLMSAPFYSSISVSPTGKSVIWLKNERGVRNIQVAETPQYIVRNLTHFTDDDGVDMSAFDWLPDGSAFYFVRGNAPQVRSASNHNPAHLLEGTVPTIWKMTLSDGKMEKIGIGNAPSVSPDGKHLVFTRGGQVYIKNTNDTAQAKQLFAAKGGCSTVRWSPDSRRLAFVSNRNDYSFVGVYDFQKKDYQFLTPSVDRDQEPSWSPDGQQLAFLRVPRYTEPVIFSTPNRETQPWSILVADVATGKTQTIFTTDTGYGSVYRFHNGQQQLLWSASNKLYFVWEKTGWTQLYSVAAQGGKTTMITEGSGFEVDEVYLTNDRKSLIFNSNQGDIDRKHVWQYSENTQLTALTSGKTIEALCQVATDGKSVFCIQTDGRTPTQVALIANGKTKTLTEQTTFPKNDLVEPEALTLKAKDGVTFYNQVFYPKNLRKDKSHRALIFVHGGSRRQMLLGYHPSSYYANAYHLSQYWASKGFVVVHLNYRSGIGYGLEFREALDFGASGASEFRDLEALGEWLKTHPSVNPSKIGVWGGSYGGYMTAHALAQRSDLFAAGADMHGVHNWNTSIPTFTPEYDSLRFPRIGQIAYKSSPIYHVDGWKSPVLLIHGDDDANVNFGETLFLQRVLRRKNVETELLVIPDEVHSFLRFQSWFTAYSAIDDFFERKIKK